ncbi:hypothetical protein M569_17074 [Genlisea aurea]|uniref:Uncharacterized protein n=1 Tax=Genlisea aurea TaxID=192259 RepID=S8BTM7_9LAMI|nr:hypothetical protein M569_17074 [Genlisea aurea]
MLLLISLKCSPAPCRRQVGLTRRRRLASILHSKRRRLELLPPRGVFSIRASSEGRERGEGSGRGGAGPNWDPGVEFEVPFEQRPVNEYTSLKDESLC